MPRDQSESLLDAAAFGAQIAELRKARGIPQDRLALAAGISRVQLQNIEAGLSDRAKRTPANPRLSTVLQLCQALEVKVVIDFAHPVGVTIKFEDT